MVGPRGESDSEQPDRGEIVRFGRSQRPGGNWLSTVALVCLVIAAVVVVLTRSGPHRPPAAHRPRPAQHPSARLPPVSVIDAGHPLLGITAGYELFGLDTGGLVSVQFATGKVTSTALPPPEGSGPVSLIVEPHQAIIRPLDDVPGYVVPDGQQARPLTGPLAAGYLLLPGPQPDDEWAVSETSTNSMSLLGPTGRQTGVSITLPGQWSAQGAMPDGRGEVLLFGNNGGQYDAGPTWLRRVGAVLVAVGPTRWLGEVCHDDRCHNVVINAASGAYRTLSGPAVTAVTWPWPWEPGVVAPDGSTAAVVEAEGYGRVTLELINLSSGAVTRVAAPVSDATSSQTMAWSPDSRWLFVAGPNGKLIAVSARTGRVEGLGVPLPPGITQLAIRGPS